MARTTVILIVAASVLYIFIDHPKVKLLRHNLKSVRIGCFSYEKKLHKFPNNASRSSTKQKLILLYTTFFGSSPWEGVAENDNFIASCGCDFNGCEITYDQKRFPESDGVLFHGHNMPCVSILDELKKYKKPTQVWIYFSLESPLNSPSVKAIETYFDMAVTYRFESDVRLPYGKAMKRTEIKFTLKNHAANKTGLVGWYVSHCGRLRDQLAHKLDDYGVKIEVAGTCAWKFKHVMSCKPAPCPLNKYKFYFAAENYLCKDYITEKYWVNALDNDAIPIVLGGANYSKLAIPGSFINAFSFKNVKELADYILELDRDDQKFNEYFKWKEDWKQHKEKKDWGTFMCDICKKLKNGINVKGKKLLSSYIGPQECEQGAKYFQEWIER